MATTSNASSTECEKSIPVNMTTKFINFLISSEEADCSFKCDDKEIIAHRKLLAACSSVFTIMFNVSWGSHANPIRIVDATYDNFATFIDFFYKGEIKLNAENVMSILCLAHKYDVQELTSTCSTFACDQICVENVVEYFELAIRLNQEYLRFDCIEFITENTEAVLKSEKFLQCGMDALKGILQIDELSCKETVVFDSCIEWAKNKCRIKNLDELQEANLRDQLTDCIHLIRFKEMESEEFAERYEFIGPIITKETSSKVFMHFMQKASVTDSRYIKWRKSGDQKEITFSFAFVRKLPLTNRSTEIRFSLDESIMLCGVEFSQPHSANIPKFLCLDANILVKQGDATLMDFTAKTTNEEYGRVTFPKLLFIQNGKLTNIQINLASCPFDVTIIQHGLKSYKEDSISISINNNTNYSFISALHFQRCSDENYKEHFGEYLQFKE